MSFDIQHEVALVFNHQRTFLCSTGNETEPDFQALSDSLYALVDTASEEDFAGVADALALYGELLSQVCEGNQYPTDQRILDLMVQTAAAFKAFLQGNEEAVPLLINLLENSGWPEPVPEEDTTFLVEILSEDQQRIMGQASANGDTRLAQPEDTPQPAADLTVELNEVELNEVVLVEEVVDSSIFELLDTDQASTPEAAINTLQAPTVPEPSTSAAQSAAHKLSSLSSPTKAIEYLHELVDLFSEEELAGIADSCALAAELLDQEGTNEGLAQQLITALSTLLSEANEASLSVLLDTMGTSNWPSPVAEDDLCFLKELLEEELPTLHGSLPATDISCDQDNGASDTTDISSVTPTALQPFCEIDSDLLEEAGPNIDPAVLQMLTQSIVELTASWQKDDVLYDGRLIAESTDALTMVCRALETLNLRGIHLLLGGLQVNLQQMAVTEPTQARHSQLARCLQSVQEHLSDIENRSIQTTLIDLCRSPVLPCPLSEDQAEFLEQLLAQASIQTAKDIAKQTAASTDVSIEIQDDLDPNLHDMLLVELPSLTDDFLNSLQKVIETGSLQDLDAARRTAHTIKGLGNMAGIQGLANLTHELENILDTLVDTQSLPGQKLKDDLQEAADCLAAMSESVTDKMAPPNNALPILQGIMDWSYLLKTEGVSAAGGERPENVSSDSPRNETPQEAPKAKPTPAVTEPQERKEESFLRVPQTLLDNLFRITGESNTLTSQQDESITQLRTLTRTNRERQRHLQHLIFELEQQLNEYYTLHPELDPESEGFDPLEMDNYNEMHTSLSRLHESAADVREVEQEMDAQIRHLTDLHVAQSGLQKENLSNILSTRLVAVKTISTRVQRIMRQACRAAEKKAQLKIEGEDTLVDSQILAQLTDPLMHIIRNAVDHGLEKPQERLDAGKSEEGLLKLRFYQENDEIRIACEDDGNGIDTDKVRSIAAQKGLVEEHAILSDTELQRIILLPGFSTRDEVSQLSGRGIGLDVVNQQIMRMQGTLSIDSTRGQGTRFELSMPASSLMIRALLVRAGRQLVALSSHGIEQSILSLDGQLHQVGDEYRFTVGDEEYPALALETLLAEPRAQYGGDNIHPVLIINLGQGEKAALMVKEIIAHRELVFKEMGEYLPDLPGIPGVTILANGEAAPIIDLPARVQHHQTSHIEFGELLESETLPDLPKLMVVDDSISARKALVTLLKDTGYEVSTAIDGLDALNQIRKDPPDLILTDLEMPRMSGIELSSAIRNNAATSDIPVIMITSRSSDRHRNEAKAAGISSYLSKPWTENNLLDQVQTHLKREVPEAAPEKVLM